MQKFGWVLFFLMTVAVAHSRPEFWTTYRDHYKLEDSFPNMKAGCLNCHSSVPQRNPYGIDVQGVLASQAAINGEMLSSIESKDSDGDGFPNGDEIKAGFLPGDSASHPDGTPTVPVAPKPSTNGTGESTLSIPEHRFHPLVVHFPIALFIFGALLDVLGHRRGDEGMRKLALWNLGAGALCSLLAVPTGVLALFALQWELQGNVLFHFVGGLSAAGLMLATFLYRRQQESPPTSPAYWILLALAITATTITGHLGSVLVFGG